MNGGYEAPLKLVARGLLAGVGSAVVLTVVLSVGRRVLFRPVRDAPARGPRGITASEALGEEPGVPPNMNRVTATFVQKVATGIFGMSLGVREQYVAGTAWHLGYGGFWGAVYALLQGSVGAPKRLLGPAYGLGVWAVGPAWLVPRMKLMLPPTQQRPHIAALVLGAHALYGALLALGLHLLGDRS